MSMAAAAAGADGLIIEVPNNPPAALCDGQQSITPEAFRRLDAKINALRNALTAL
jgi:3-deoxy-7-phosphoheptulonate synthase